MTLLDGLNAPQRRAAEHTDGPLLLLAGAGSGKTRTVTHRAARLVATGKAKPWDILCVTFTNKAAGEMKERLADLMGKQAGKQVWCMTFHALCVRILRRNAEQVGFPSKFSILDTTDVRKLVRGALGDVLGEGADIDASEVRKLAAQISKHKNAMRTPAQVAGHDPRLAQVWKAYARRCRDMAAMDFDDLMLFAIDAVRTPEGREAWAGRWSYVHVDEYQDTNGAQEVLLRLLMGDGRNICVVGDDFQAIYAFRGAQVDHILRFPKEWPDAQVIKLEDNYRSSGAIIEAANAVIAKSGECTAKTLRANHDQGAPVRLVQVDNQWDEARLVATRIAEFLNAGGTAEDVAVVYRNNAQSRALEEKLAEKRIPYKVVGGVEFYRRAEVQAARAWLQLLDNPRDIVAFNRAATTPRRGIGDASLQAVAAAARESGRSVVQVAADADALGVPAKAKTGLREVARVLADAERALESQPLSKVLGEVIRGSGQLDALKAAGKDGVDQLENLAELMQTAERYDRAADVREALTMFLEQTALTDATAGAKTQGVSLMTFHATKGLEFGVVFLTGLEDELFLRGEPDAKNIEEERRLLYVGLTRAMRLLHLSCCASRRMYGGQEQPMRPLRFLADLPPSVQRLKERPKRSVMGDPDRRAGDPPYRRGSRTAPRRGQSAGRAQRPSATNRPTPAAAAETARRQPVKAPKATRSFSAGERVRHAQFGVGTVTRGGSDAVAVRFDGAGQRTVMGGYLTAAS